MFITLPTKYLHFGVVPFQQRFHFDLRRLPSMRKKGLDCCSAHEVLVDDDNVQFFRLIAIFVQEIAQKCGHRMRCDVPADDHVTRATNAFHPLSKHSCSPRCLPFALDQPITTRILSIGSKQIGELRNHRRKGMPRGQRARSSPHPSSPPQSTLPIRRLKI